MSLKEKVLAMQLEAEQRKLEYIMPKEDRKLFREANEKEKAIFKHMLELGVTQQEIKDLMSALEIQKALIKKHKKTYKERIKG